MTTVEAMALAAESGDTVTLVPSPETHHRQDTGTLHASPYARSLYRFVPATRGGGGSYLVHPLDYTEVIPER